MTSIKVPNGLPINTVYKWLGLEEINMHNKIRPMRIDKLQGLRCEIVTIDEWLSGNIREDVVGGLSAETAMED